jgi:hypothetical protein
LIIIHFLISLLTNYENSFRECLIVVKQNIEINLAFHSCFMKKNNFHELLNHN